MKIGRKSYEKNDLRSRTRFWGKCGVLSLHDIYLKKRYTIDHKEIFFVKKDKYTLIGNPDQPDGTSMYHEYFFCDDLFDQVLETNHNHSISLNIIHQNVIFPQ